MNKEVIKAMSGRETKLSHLKKWWDKNDYKVVRVILFPIWLAILAHEKIGSWLNSKQKWSAERADEILNYYIPRRADWSEEDKSFYFFDNGMGWSYTKKIKLKDRRWWRCYEGFWGGEIRKYLINDFELDGFKKEVVDTYDGRTEIIFHLIEKE